MSDTIDQIPEIPAGASPVAPGTLAKGVPFDPARHIPRTNPKTGAWMPKGGRKPKTAAPSSGSTSSPPAPTEPATSANSSPSPAGSPAAPAPAAPPAPEPLPNFADIDAAAASAPAPEPSPAESAKAADANAKLVDNLEQQADGLCRAVYYVLGWATGAPDETTRRGAEHAGIRDAVVSWMNESGIRFKGWKSLALVALAYVGETFTRPKSAAKARSWKEMIFPPKSKPAPASEPSAPTESAPPQNRSVFIGE